MQPTDRRISALSASPDPAGILLGLKGGDIKVGDAVEWLAEQDAKEAKDRKWTLIMAIIAAFAAIVGMIGLGGH